MKLLLSGVPTPFTLDLIEVDVQGGATRLQSDDLSTYIAGLNSEIERLTSCLADSTPSIPDVPAVPVPPKAKVFVLEATAKVGAGSLDAFREQGWSDDLLVEHGYAEKVEVIEPEPEVVPTPPAPKATPTPPPAPKVVKEVPVVEATPEVPAPKAEPEIYVIDGIQYKEAGKAAGCTRAQFLESGWTDESLIVEGYIVEIEGQNLKPEATTNDEGQITDSEGTVFDPELHGTSKDGSPALTTKGVFKKRRVLKSKADAAAKTPEVPAAKTPEVPKAPAADTPEVPKAPAADTPEVPKVPEAAKVPEVPTVGGVEEEDLDDELASIIKGW